jgi:hypothetical protein
MTEESFVTQRQRARATVRTTPDGAATLDNTAPHERSMLLAVQGNLRLARALWPALLAAVGAFVVADFLHHPFLGAASDAAAPPQAHLTLWLAQTEAGGEGSDALRETAASLQLYGRPATVGLLAGGASQAVSGFLAHRHTADQLLAVSSETLADLAQERAGALYDDEPLRAALAQRLLARATPVGVLGADPLAIAVPQGSPIRDVGRLLADLRRSAQAHVFAIVNDSWAADNLAALVRDAGVEGVVPYRVFPSPQDASLALAAGEAEVILAPRGALVPDLRAHRLRALAWPAGAGGAPRFWVELLAPPGVDPGRVRALRRQLRALSHNAVWRRLLGGPAAAPALAGDRLRGFLAAQLARTARLQRVAARVERR